MNDPTNKSFLPPDRGGLWADSELTAQILVVDDNPVVLKLIERMLNSFGLQCLTARDGIEALERLGQGEFSLVITDLVMPRMDGMSLLRKIKNLYPRLDVIVVTSYPQKTSYTEVIKAGACDFITKPFSSDELEAKLRRVLREQELVSKLEKLSKRDSLTGLYNRRGFENKLYQEIPRAHRQDYQVFLAIIDLDKFKIHNDRFGHQAGDQVLKSIGRLLLANTRENVDHCCRQGGDEFAIILPCITHKQALAVTQRILEQYRLSPHGDITLSIGLALFVRHLDKSWGEDIKDLAQRADLAMYSSKQRGGNRIECDHCSPPASSDHGPGPKQPRPSP